MAAGYHVPLLFRCCFLLVIALPQEIRKTVILDISNSSSVSPNIISIGAPLTIDPVADSKHRTVGMMVKHAYEIFVDWINLERGGITVAGKQYMLRLVLVDDHGTPNGATSATKYIVEGLGVKIVMGPLDNTLSVASAAIVNQSGGLMVAAFAGHPDIFRARPNIFGLLTAAESWKNEAVFVLASKGAKTIVIVHENSKISRKLILGIGLAANQVNITISATIRGPHQWNDGFEEAVARCRELDPDVVMTIFYSADGDINFLKALRRAKYQPKMLAGGPIPPDILERFSPELPGDTGRFAIGMTLWHHHAPFNSTWAVGWTAKSFGAKYEQLHDKSPIWQAASGWAAMEVIVQSMEAANSLEPSLIADHMRVLETETIFGPVKFQGGANMAKTSFLQYNANSAVPIFVAPPEAAQGDLIYPMPRWEDRKCILVTPEKSVYGFASSGNDNPDRCQVCPEVAIFNEAKQRRVCISCPAGQSAVAFDGIGDLTHYGNIPLRICQKVCPPGHALGVDRKCESCDAGRFELGARCYSCLAGAVTTEAGMTLCPSCVPGKFAAASGMSLCENCSAGRFAADLGEKECRNCTKGKISIREGSSACVRCKIGTFARDVGTTSCISCGVNSATPREWTTMQYLETENGLRLVEFEGAADRNWCGCKAGTYVSGSGTSRKCSPCGKGLHCPGMDEAFVDEGFMSMPNDIFSIYTCVGSSVRCPGQRPVRNQTLMCGKGFEGIRCAWCGSDYFLNRGGLCSQCEEQRDGADLWLKVVGTLTINVALIAFMYVRSNRPGTAGEIISGFLLGFLQVLLQLGKLPLNWPPVLQWLFSPSALNLFSVDGYMHIFQIRYECFAGSGIYPKLITNLIVPLVPLFSMATLSVALMLLRKPLVFDFCVNTVSICFKGIFITFLAMSLQVFVTETMPNNRRMVREFPSLEYGSPSWIHITPFAILAFCFYCLTFLAFVTHAVVVAPRQAASWAGFVARYRFAFGPLRPDRWWYILIEIAYSIAMVFVQILATTVDLSLYLSAITLMIVTCLGMILEPFKFRLCNFTDSALKSCLLIFGLLSTAFIDPSLYRENNDMFANIAFCSIMLGFSYAVFAIALWLGRILLDRQGKVSRSSRSVLIRALEFRDLATAICDMSHTKYTSALGSLEEQDLCHLDNVMRTMTSIFLKLQPSQKLLRQRIMPGVRFGVWDQRHTLMESLCAVLNGEFQSNAMQQAAHRLLLIQFAEYLREIATHVPAGTAELSELKNAISAAATSSRTYYILRHLKMTGHELIDRKVFCDLFKDSSRFTESELQVLYNYFNYNSDQLRLDTLLEETLAACPPMDAWMISRFQALKEGSRTFQSFVQNAEKSLDINVGRIVSRLSGVDQSTSILAGMNNNVEDEHRSSSPVILPYCSDDGQDMPILSL